MRISDASFVDAMQALINNQNEKTTKVFEEEILETYFITPAVFLNDDPNIPLEKRNISFINITDGAGDIFFLAFTDTEKFNKFKKENEFHPIDVKLSDFKHLLTEIDSAAKGFVINIGDEALFISKDTFL